MNKTFEKYTFSGNVFLWKYPNSQSNYPGINLTADAKGCDSLLDLMSRFSAFEEKPKKRIDLSETTQKIASVGTSKVDFKFYKTLTLNFVSGEESTWIIEESMDKEVILSFSKVYLKAIEEAIRRVKIGEGDFYISDGKRKHILWFWWCL